MTTAAASLPTHEVVYRQARDLVLFGELAPGAAVTIQGIVDRLDAGITPVREAIRRLIAEARCWPQITGAFRSRGLPCISCKS
ncbi:GntR family transcriptional regulator [Sulfitobacter sp. S190]|uniref:GntR family transcriptional regulator n=1 Tax=Sulfitobacter sp. S190 TaxID=2867022 RepID=UPI0028834EF3|nr:GntR family transcriptional regulator [Sulfitobacter sp. S190]